MYNTPHAFIYASSHRAGAEAGRLTTAVVSEFETETGGKVTKGLLIVTDRGDEPVITTFHDLHRLLSKSATANSDGRLASELAETRREMKKHRVKLETLLTVTPIPLGKDDLKGILAFPAPLPRSVTWAAAIPSRAAIREVNKTVIKKLLEEEGFGPIAQIILAPILFVAEESMLNIVGTARNVVLYEQFAMLQPGWAGKEKKQCALAYGKRKRKEAMGFLSLLRKNKKAVKKMKR